MKQWSGELQIGDIFIQVTAYERNSNGLKEWYGSGTTSFENGVYLMKENRNTFVTKIGELFFTEIKFTMTNVYFEFQGTGQNHF
jgi:hypothetical protein